MQPQACWQALLPILARHTRCAPLLTGALRSAARSGAPALLSLAVGLFRLAPVRERWLAAPGWRDAFETLLTLRQPTSSDLKTLLPAVYWPGAAAGEFLGPLAPDPELPGLHERRVRVDEAAYRAACERLGEAAAAVEERHFELCALLAATPALLTGAPLVSSADPSKGPRQDSEVDGVVRCTPRQQLRAAQHSVSR